MKVLLLAQFYPPDIGGEERHVHSLAGELARRGHTVAVATQSLGGHHGVSIENGVLVHRLPSAVGRLALGTVTGRPHLPPLPDPEFTVRLAKLVRAFRPDVMHAHNWVVNSAVAVPRGRRTPLVLTLHDYGHVCATQRLMQFGTDPCSGPAPKKCLPCSQSHYGPARGTATLAGLRATAGLRDHRIDHLLAVSSAVARGTRLSTGDTPWQVVPNFVPTALLEEHETFADDVLPDGDYAVFVGDQTKHKGLPVLLEALPVLRERGLPLVCVGGRSDVDGELPEGVVATGQLSHDRVMNAVRRATVAVVPSTWPDPCPTTVLEAMASRTPVVAAASGGIVDMVLDGETGLLVEPGNAGELGQALAKVLDDRAYAAELAAAAHARAALFADTAVVTRIEAVYADAIRARS